MTPRYHVARMFAAIARGEFEAAATELAWAHTAASRMYPPGTPAADTAEAADCARFLDDAAASWERFGQPNVTVTHRLGDPDDTPGTDPEPADPEILDPIEFVIALGAIAQAVQEASVGHYDLAADETADARKAIRAAFADGSRGASVLGAVLLLARDYLHSVQAADLIAGAEAILKEDGAA